MSDNIKFSDIQKLANLEQEISVIEKRREEIMKYNAEVMEDIIRKKAEYSKEKERELSEMRVETARQEAFLLQSAQAIEAREKNVSAKEKETASLERDRWFIESQKKAVELWLNDINVKLSEVGEREHAASLLEDKYNKLLKELTDKKDAAEKDISLRIFKVSRRESMVLDLENKIEVFEKTKKDFEQEEKKTREYLEKVRQECAVKLQEAQSTKEAYDVRANELEKEHKKKIEALRR